MRKLVKFTKNATFFPPSPQLQIEVEVTYIAESEILYDEHGEEEEINLLKLAVEINGKPAHFDWPKWDSDGRKFHAYMREAARDAAYMESQKTADDLAALRQMQESLKDYKGEKSEFHFSFEK